MTPRRLGALATAALLAPLALAACSSADDAAPAATGTPIADRVVSADDADATGESRLSVLASFYPLQFVAEQVGGDLVDVTNLTPPAADPHNLELSPARAREVSEADVVIILGGFQAAVDDAVATREPANLVDAADVVDLLPATVTGGEHDHAEDEHADHDHAEDEHADHDHAEDAATEEDHAEEDHDHSHDMGGYDPHFWLDPTLLAQLAHPVADALSAADPTNTAAFEANADALVARLTELDATMAEALTPFAGATLITNHTAFGYLAHRYGLQQVGVTGLDHDVEPAPARMREISALAREHGVTTLFYETLVSPRVIETLAADLGIEVASLNTLEGLGEDELAAGDDYVSIMLRNLDALTGGLTAP